MDFWSKMVEKSVKLVALMVKGASRTMGLKVKNTSLTEVLNKSSRWCSPVKVQISYLDYGVSPPLLS